jgi:hypothetical protein
MFDTESNYASQNTAAEETAGTRRMKIKGRKTERGEEKQNRTRMRKRKGGSRNKRRKTKKN